MQVLLRAAGQERLVLQVFPDLLRGLRAGAAERPLRAALRGAPQPAGRGDQVAHDGGQEALKIFKEPL